MWTQYIGGEVRLEQPQRVFASHFHVFFIRRLVWNKGLFDFSVTSWLD